MPDSRPLPSTPGELIAPDPGELIARYLAQNPQPEDAGPAVTTEELAQRLGLDQPDDDPDQEAPRAQD